jgi:hypothetical protein
MCYSQTAYCNITAHCIVYPPIYNALSSTTGTITFTATGSDRSLQKLIEAESEFAVVMASVMAQDNLSSALNTGQAMLLPLFLRRVVPLYTLPTLLATDNLILSFDVLSQIWRGSTLPHIHRSILIRWLVSL